MRAAAAESPVRAEATTPFTLPSPLRALGERLPQWPPSLALVALLNLALDRVLPREALEPMLGKVMRVEVADAGLKLSFRLEREGFRLSLGVLPPDLVVRANAADLAALALRRADPDALFFDRRLVMEGDTELGLIVKNTLDAADPREALPGFLKKLL